MYFIPLATSHIFFLEHKINTRKKVNKSTEYSIDKLKTILTPLEKRTNRRRKYAEFEMQKEKKIECSLPFHQHLSVTIKQHAHQITEFIFFSIVVVLFSEVKSSALNSLKVFFLCQINDFFSAAIVLSKLEENLFF